MAPVFGSVYDARLSSTASVALTMADSNWAAGLFAWAWFHWYARLLGLFGSATTEPVRKLYLSTTTAPLFPPPLTSRTPI